ncbi:hypothetical protein HPB47_018890 [Ixodes persulcatus]|uniref:Uncharacterized protein n=1 Tax=Ixodes persulcatus TaxID=34615 RepID=A0AC60QN93_IXOPE|nr:hypothetical protein HPB47_018890 [Ixodes persulcatus]
MRCTAVFVPRTSPFRKWQAQVPWEMRPVPQDIYNQQKELRTSQPETDPVDTSDEESDSEDMYSDPLDTSYRPNDSIDSDKELDSPDTSAWNDSVSSDDEGPDAECSTSATTTSPLKERKYIVCASMLLQLLSVCRECLAPTQTRLKERGTLLHAVTICLRGHKTVWESQPRINSKALMNLPLPTAITFSGASPTRVIRLLSSVGVAVLQKSQLFLIQGCLVFPAAAKVWKEEQTTLLTAMRGSKLHLAGDGHADSPGYSAKYGTYTLLDTNINKLVHFEVIQQLLKDTPKLSGDGQTYRLESFHSLLLRFTLKSSHFSLEGMEARTAIAVLHYNANSDRKQATTKDGKDCFVLKFPKARKGEWVVNRKMEPASFDYTQKLLSCFLGLAEGVRTYQEVQATYVPHSRGKSLCSVSQRPNKEAAVLEPCVCCRRKLFPDPSDHAAWEPDTSATAQPAPNPPYKLLGFHRFAAPLTQDMGTVESVQSRVEALFRCRAFVICGTGFIQIPCPLPSVWGSAHHASGDDIPVVIDPDQKSNSVLDGIVR